MNHTSSCLVTLLSLIISLWLPIPIIAAPNNSVTSSGHTEYLHNTTTYSTPPAPAEQCLKYPPDSRKLAICRMYYSAGIHEVQTLPETLEENKLYIVSSQKNNIKAPYVIPEGTSIIPCPSCSVRDSFPIFIEVKANPNDLAEDVQQVIILKERAKINGFKIDGTRLGSLNLKGSLLSLIYGQTTDSEVSDTHLTGSPDITSLIHQKLVTDEDPPTAQHYSNIQLHLRGSKYGLFVESASDAVTNQNNNNDAIPWDVYASKILVFLDTAKKNTSSIDHYRGLAFINIRPEVLSSKLFFPERQPVESKPALVAISLEDTSRARLLLNSLHSPENKRQKDKVIVITKKNTDSMEIYANDASYLWLAEDSLATFYSDGVIIYNSSRPQMSLPEITFAPPAKIQSSPTTEPPIYTNSITVVDTIASEHNMQQTPKPVECEQCSPWYKFKETWGTACGTFAAGAIMGASISFYMMWRHGYRPTSTSGS